MDQMIETLLRFLTVPENMIGPSFAAMMAIQGITIISAISARRQLRKLEACAKQQFSSDMSTDQVVKEAARAVGIALEPEVKSIGSRIEEIDTRLSSCLQRVGMVRFKAFEEVGGDLSFSLAVLDDRFNGLILTNLFGREESRMYAKPIAAGKSSYPLSSEEQEALSKALGKADPSKNS